MKRPARIFIFTIMLSTGAFAATDTQRMQKNVEILQKVLEVALQEDRKRHKLNIDSLWLANQGVLFVIHSGRFHSSYYFNYNWVDGLDDFDFTIDDNAILAAPPIPPMPHLTNSLAIVTGENHETLVHNSGTKLSKQMTELHEQMRNINKQHLEMLKQYEKTLKKFYDAQREKNKSVAEDFKRKAEEYRLKLREKAKQMKDKSIQLKEKSEKDRAQRLASYKRITAETLCDYAGSLKNLEDNQHVTFVFKHAASERGNDHIAIFSKKEIMHCQSGSISADKLLANATTYDF